MTEAMAFRALTFTSTSTVMATTTCLCSENALRTVIMTESVKGIWFVGSEGATISITDRTVKGIPSTDGITALIQNMKRKRGLIWWFKVGRAGPGDPHRIITVRATRTTRP